MSPLMFTEVDDNPLCLLALQGGGALGAYHVGVYEALDEAGQQIDWVTGVSIGAFTAALIAGNRPERRIARLEEFWNDISRSDGWGDLLTGYLRKVFNTMSNASTLLAGQPNFFTPRPLSPFFALPGTPEATSFYDTRPVRETLKRLVDFDLINAGDGAPTRLSLGATRVTTGDLVFFDSARSKIGPEHVMASGALPPGFPAIVINGTQYWDGGCVTNTPLDVFTHGTIPSGQTLLFIVDLFDAEGPAPATMDELSWRSKAIQYGGRTTASIEAIAAQLTLRRTIARLVHELPVDNAVRKPCADMAYTGRVDIARVVYRRGPDELVASDAEFSRPSIKARRAQGYEDVKILLDAAPWTKAIRGADSGVVVHEVNQGQVETRVFSISEGKSEIQIFRM